MVWKKEIEEVQLSVPCKERDGKETFHCADASTWYRCMAFHDSYTRVETEDLRLVGQKELCTGVPSGVQSEAQRGNPERARGNPEIARGSQTLGIHDEAGNYDTTLKATTV